MRDDEASEVREVANIQYLFVENQKDTAQFYGQGVSSHRPAHRIPADTLESTT